MELLLDPRRRRRRQSTEPYIPDGILARASNRYPDSFSPFYRTAMAALLADARAPVWPVALTVAGPPRILTAFHVPGICHHKRYTKNKNESII